MKRLLAAALALALALVAAWIVLRREERQQRIDRAESRLLQFDDRSVEAIILTLDGTDWRFEKGPGGWRLVAPVEDAADEAALQELLSRSRRTPVTEVVEDPEVLSAYGLDPPAGILRLEGVETPALHIGEVTPTADGRFARVEGRPGVLVLDPVMGVPLLSASPSVFRDHSLSGLLRSEITSLDIRSRSSKVRLEREAENWWVTEPLRIPASGTQVERLLGALEGSQVSRFLDGADPTDPRFGLGAGALEIELHTPDKSRTILLGHAAGADLRYAMRDDRPAVLGVQQEPLASMPVELDRLASTRLTLVNRYRVSRFEYRNGVANLIAAQAGEEEVWMTSDRRVMDEGEVYSLLVRILEARVSGWREGAVQGEPPLASLDFWLEDGVTDRIDFYSGNRAQVASLPHVTFLLAAPPPPIPSTLASR